jgi:hypothetical protein
MHPARQPAACQFMSKWRIFREDKPGYKEALVTGKILMNDIEDESTWSIESQKIVPQQDSETTWNDSKWNSDQGDWRFTRKEGWQNLSVKKQESQTAGRG